MQADLDLDVNPNRQSTPYKPCIFRLKSLYRGSSNQKKCYHRWYHLVVGKIRRGNYVFLSWQGDHSPRHVHVYRSGKLELKWDLENWQPMRGKPSRRVLKLIEELAEEGKL